MVEWKKLGDVANLVRGKVISKDFIRDNVGDYPVYSSQTANDGVMGCINSFMFDGDYLTWTTDGAYAGTVFRRKGKFNITNVCGLIDIIEAELNQDFLYYWLALTAKGYVLEGMGNPKLMSNVASNIRIPILPVLQQTRIVGILDTFTSAIDNLKEQIAQRRKQYEYYRDQLLDLEGKEGMEMKILKDVFDTRNGYTPSTSNNQFWDDGIIPWFKMEDIRDNGRILNDSKLHITSSAIKGKGLFRANSIILATSATIGEHALITVDHLCNQRFTNFYPKKCYQNSINMKFVYYYMYRIDEWCKQHINQGGFASVDMSGLDNLNIPLPPLQEQQRIVSILDTFEASIQNLEAQLKQREKQYEYYRNKLLTFEYGAITHVSR